MFRKSFPVLLLIFNLVLGIEVGSSEEQQLPIGQLVERLREGGYTLYFRHAATDHTRDDNHPVDLNDCKTQRNLSIQGRTQAKMIGKELNRLGISVGEVLTSPYCRCRDTAQLTFGHHQIDENLYFAVVAGPEERRRISGILRSMLSRSPAVGTNNVIVSHTANLREATGIWPKPEGVAWVFQPDGSGGFKVLGKIDPTEWSFVQ